jgi:hypothetical protein
VPTVLELGIISLMGIVMLGISIFQFTRPE